MTGLELALAIAGVVITIMVVAGMFLIVPGGVEAAPVHRADPVPPDPERGRDRAARQTAERPWASSPVVTRPLDAGQRPPGA